MLGNLAQEFLHEVLGRDAPAVEVPGDRALVPLDTGCVAGEGCGEGGKDLEEVRELFDLRISQDQHEDRLGPDTVAVSGPSLRLLVLWPRAIRLGLCLRLGVDGQGVEGVGGREIHHGLDYIIRL
ncbi:hypothetical protein [Kitasatospora sp. NPDC058046]|uniref:hypothetical protein n=1 Tax=Kitasatospora sp. NPDC058046 TaxID=3346312 RepID=UPI0036DF2110